MRILLTLALLCGCGCAGIDLTKPISDAPDLVTFLKNPHGCETTCGMRAPRGGDCADLEAYEREIVAKLGASQNDWTPEKVCAALKGYKVEAVEMRPLDDLCADKGGGWVLFFVPGGYFCAEGYTDNEAKVIKLKSNDWRHTPLAHEVVHAVNGAPKHCRWASLSLRIAVSELMGEVDDSKPEPSCSP